MYSGSTVRTKSGRILGVHQKIDQIARRSIKSHLPKGLVFPSEHDILHFEGLNGPDGIKRKSPGRDEPWHYIDPKDPHDVSLLDMIDDHIFNLTTALVKNNSVRASFEAAWLAHAITDGLTPAHHYPLDDKIEELWGKPKEERQTIRDKNIIQGSGRRDTFVKNWEYWGAKGVFTNHFMFEWGVATSLNPLRLENCQPNGNDIVRVQDEGFRPLFLEMVHDIANLEMYDEFAKQGWTRHLAGISRDTLIPKIIQAVALSWIAASLRAESKRKKP